MCYVRSIPPGAQNVRLRPCIKSTVFFLIETEFTARYEMLKIIQVKFSLQSPRTVTDRQFVGRFEHTLLPNRLLTPMLVNHTTLHIQLSPCG